MKLKSLKKMEILNNEDLLFINGGTSLSYNHTRGHDTLHNDSLKQDGGGSTDQINQL